MSPRAHGIIAGIGIALCCGLAPAHAQETPPSDGAESFSEPATQRAQPDLRLRLDIVRQRAGGRVAESRATLIVTPDKREARLNARKRAMDRRDDARSECRTRIRAANRDQLFEVTMDCYRGELQLLVEILRDERAHVEVTPGLPPSVSSETTARYDALIEASQAVIYGIDAGVYETMEDLADAKRRLHAQYRVPLLLSSLRARAASQRSWLAFAANKIAGLFDAMPGLDQSPVAESGVACLEILLETLEETEWLNEYGKMKDVLSQYESRRLGCVAALRDIARWNPEAVQTGAGDGNDGSETEVQ